MESETKSETVSQDTSNKEEAFTHLAQGKRHLLVKDYSEAVTSLASACQLLSQLYGEFANECGEAYFNYGKALLELARTENGVLGIEGEGEGSENSDDEEEEGEADDKEENQDTHLENGKTDDKNEVTEADGEEEGNETNEKKETKNTSEVKTENETEEKEKNEDGTEDDVSNLHLAWEMLEMAKIIFSKQAKENVQYNLRLAEVNLKLGEVGLESENYTQAIDDIKACLEIQIQNLDEHDRCIAETHYQLGMAYSLHNDFDEAIEQLTNAHKLLEKRIDYLKEKEKKGTVDSEQNEANPFYSIKDEIAEINSLLPEVKEKISDMEDFKKETMKALIAGFGAKKEQKTNSEAGEGTSAGSSSEAFPAFQSSSDVKAASDISHLVRRKRKLEPDSSEEKSSKQPCPE